MGTGLGRTADQQIGQELQAGLTPSLSLAVGTWHVGLLGGASTVPPYGFKTGAPVVADALQSAGKFLHLIVDLTVPNGGTITVTIVGIDFVSGKIYTILASAALAAIATTVLKVGPGLTAGANLTANDFIPLAWGVQVVVATAAVTFSLGALQMP